MQVFRTLMWLVILAALLLFSYFNWNEVTVKIWENLVVETKVPALVVVSFLLGLIPMWIYHRGARWSLTRKIVALENAARAQSANAAREEREMTAATTPAAAPAPTHDPALDPEPRASDAPPPAGEVRPR